MKMRVGDRAGRTVSISYLSRMPVVRLLNDSRTQVANASESQFRHRNVVQYSQTIHNT